MGSGPGQTLRTGSLGENKPWGCAFAWIPALTAQSLRQKLGEQGEGRGFWPWPATFGLGRRPAFYTCSTNPSWNHTPGHRGKLHNLENVESSHSYFCLFFIKSCTKARPLSFLPTLAPFLATSNPSRFVTICLVDLGFQTVTANNEFPQGITQGERGFISGTSLKRNHVAFEKVKRRPLCYVKKKVRGCRSQMKTAHYFVFLTLV